MWNAMRRQSASSARGEPPATSGGDMKTATSRRSLNPSATSLRAMPEVDFRRYRIRRNPYAARIAREGIAILHDGPSEESLAEIPEADFRSARVRRNPYASRAAE